MLGWLAGNLRPAPLGIDLDIDLDIDLGGTGRSARIHLYALFEMSR